MVPLSLHSARQSDLLQQYGGYPRAASAKTVEGTGRVVIKPFATWYVLMVVARMFHANDANSISQYSGPYSSSRSFRYMRL